MKNYNIKEKIMNKEFKEKTINLIETITIALGISLFLFFFVVIPSQVEGRSMEPTFYTGERLYTNRLSHWFNGTSVGEVLNLDYKRGDIVVLQIPGNDALIKRIIGLPGEKIEIKNGHFYINDQLLKEDYLDPSVETQGGSFLREKIPQNIPEGYYFVAGDNRSVSNDSRYFGFVKTEWLIGKPFIRIWPLDRFGGV